MDFSQDGLDFLKEREGLKLHSYQDDAKVWTIGYGFTAGVGPGMTTTAEEAEAKLLRYVLPVAAQVNHMLHVPVTQNQFDALVNLAYNIGAPSLEKSTLLRKLNAGDVAGAADQFLVWDKIHVDGQILEDKGLLDRRELERDLFLGDDAE